jgi:uncharacterized membrane protein (DUF2068 family)
LNRHVNNLSAGYGLLFLTEGTGLLLRKRWAEWLTIIATGSFIPLEVYELVREFTAVRLALLLVNTAVLVFLILSHTREESLRNLSSPALPAHPYARDIRHLP